MKKNNVSSGGFLLVTAATICTYKFISPPGVLPSVCIAMIVLVTMTSLRGSTKTIIFLVGSWLFYWTIVASGRIAGGALWKNVLLDGINTFSLLLTILIILTLLIVCVRREDILLLMDHLKLPRVVSYVLLSVLALISTVKEMGQKQIALLQVKGLVGNTFAAKIGAYWRIVGPLFATLLTHQLIHARSLTFRGFFNKPSLQKDALLKINAMEWLIFVLLILNFLLWKIVQVWNF